MPSRKTVLSVPPSFVEVVQLAKYYAKGKGKNIETISGEPWND